MHEPRRAHRAGLLSATLLVAGCSLAPNYHRPTVAVPAAFKEVPTGWTSAAPAADAPAQAWWQAFGDPVLNDLEGRIEGANPSLAAAVARYDQARGALHEAQADFYPQVGVGGSSERDRTSAHAPTSKGVSSTFNDYTAGASLSWEIDLFGRIRNSVRASRAETQASAADVAGVRLALQAQLATAYFNMRGLDARQVLLSQTVDAYQRAYDLTITRHEGGIASGLDTSRARTQLATAKTELSAIHADRAAYEHAIAVLVGEPASGFSLPANARPIAAPGFPASVPSVLLQRRPDIDAAERRVFEANARIGVAKAALFPSLSLGSSGGFETIGPSLLTSASSFWVLGPASLAMSVFDGGARLSRLRIARAEFTEASANYKQTVLNAFREVEDDLAQSRDLVAELRDQGDAASSADRTRDLALIRYRDGASDYLEVVTAQTAALDAERALLALRTSQLTTAVDGVRAMGGTDGAPSPETPPARRHS